jgi:hypothetical protein
MNDDILMALVAKGHQLVVKGNTAFRINPLRAGGLLKGRRFRGL